MESQLRIKLPISEYTSQFKRMCGS